MQETQKDELIAYCSKEYLLFYLAEDKMKIANYLLQSFQSSRTPAALSSHFFIDVMHIYFRSAAIDLSALFINNKSTAKFNFHRLYQNNDFFKVMKAETRSEIERVLEAIKPEIDRLLVLRDKQLAHYDGQSIRYSVEDIPMFDRLLEVGNTILTICGKELGIHYMNIPSNYEDLERWVLQKS